MAGGYAGKILRLDLTNRQVLTINTSDYEEWGGGHGIASAIFWDLAVAPGKWDLMDGLDPRNIISLMTGPLAGTVTPSAGRTEVQSVGLYGYPIDWFTRSNFGGRFAGMLKMAGWDGVIVEGKADSPVWINIVDDKVTIEDAGPDGDNLWGLDTWLTQQEIWRRVSGNARFDEWRELGEAYTTQRPAVVACGPAGENLCRSATIIHDAGHGAGQMGAGGVFGSKNLKAVSVLGSGRVEIADPEALMDARLWFIRQHGYNVNSPLHERTDTLNSYTPGKGARFYEANRMIGCQGCVAPCKRRYQSGTYNESTCADFWYGIGNSPRVVLGATDTAHKYGINTRDLTRTRQYVKNLNLLGILGPGKEIESAPVPLDLLGTQEFADTLLKAISYREGIGADLADGVIRAAEKWGRLEEDLTNGLLEFPMWGNEKHYTVPDVERGYGSIVGDRDINENDFQFAWGVAFAEHQEGRLPAKRLVEIMAEKTVPYNGDPFMFDYSEGPTGIYSENKAKLVAWHRHYSRFWKQSVLYCDWIWASFINPNTPDLIGYTPEGEPKFFNAVTGKNISFADGVEIGRRIWNLDRAIWILQGRHRDMEKFSGYVHKMPHFGVVPAYEDGEWTIEQRSIILDEAKVEEWKTHYYKLEGWDTSSGWPTEATLEGLDLGYVADKLKSKGKLGA